MAPEKRLKKRVRLSKDNRVLHGSGFIDKLIDKLPVELHVPGYKYCGPGDYKCHFLNNSNYLPKCCL